MKILIIISILIAMMSGAIYGTTQILMSALIENNATPDAYKKLVK